MLNTVPVVMLPEEAVLAGGWMMILVFPEVYVMSGVSLMYDRTNMT